MHQSESLPALEKDFKRMKLTAMNCPSCGARLEVDSERTRVFCSYCGAQIHIDDEVQRIEHKIEYSNAEDAGYQFEKGRQKAMAEAAWQSTSVSPTPSASQAQPAPKKKRKTWLWVLGWIFIFPVPLTIIMLKKKDLKPVVRYGVIAAAWIAYAIWMGSSSSGKNKTEDTSSKTVATQSEEGKKAESSNAIVLEGGKDNDYSTTKTINQGTDLEETRVIFNVPAGKYDARNVGKNRAQVNVYSNAEVEQGESMEPADGKATLIEPGETQEIEVPEGYYIYIVQPDKIELTVK